MATARPPLSSQQSGAAEFLGAKQISVDFVDHYKGEGEDFDYHWEERWIRDEGYMKLVPRALEGLFADTGVSAGDVTHFVMPCVIRRVGAMVAKTAGIPGEAICDNMHNEMGESGTAHALVMLAKVLETAKPGDIIVIAGFGQGYDAVMFKVADNIEMSAADGVSGSSHGALKRRTTTSISLSTTS